ncbi:MAG TPA: multidrug efflux RND transporter permease subunit [Chthoniobacterales bacterium]
MKFSYFFIERPIFASVLSILILLAGGITAFLLPIAQFPDVVPPTVVVSAFYPGANAQTLADTVATPIEEQINGVTGMLYMSSQSTNTGSLTLTVTFAQGTDPDIAQVLVQNQVAIALPLLPQIVRQIGVVAQKSSPNFMLLINLISPNGKYDAEYLSNYAQIQIVDPLKRVSGVGSVQPFGLREYSMRVWLNPDRMAGLGLTVDDVILAIQNQNIQVAAGTIGAPPTPKGTLLQLPVSALGRLVTPEQFGDIIIKTGNNGQLVRIRDVGTVQLGAQDYTVNSYIDGKPTVALGVSLEAGANAVATSGRVRAKMEELAKHFNPGLAYTIDYDTTAFVISSLNEVFHTLLIAIVLVVVVVLIFLQTWRASIIPLITVPVSLIGTFAALYCLGYSLNTLSLFGLVLAIGIVVDDAIVIVENCERHIAEGLPPKEAARKALDEVGAPVITVAVVLTAVFLPSALLPGISGQFYRQFAVTIATATIISAFNSLTLSPALCGLLLQKSDAKKDLLTRTVDRTIGWFFTWFNRAFHRGADAYSKLIRRILRFAAIALIIYAGLLILTYLGFKVTPTGFIPTQDQGFLLMGAQLPDAASLDRTEAVTAKIDSILRTIPAVAHTVAISGFSILSGTSQSNANTIFVILKPFEERNTPNQSMFAVLQEIEQKTAGIQEATVATLPPPPIQGIGAVGGFQLEIEDQGDLGLGELQAVSNQLMGAAYFQPGLAQVYTPLRTEVPQLFVNIDRAKVQRLGVPISSVFDTLQTYLGALYVNDFNFLGRTYQVNVQANSDYRAQADQIGRLYTRNGQNKMVPMSTIADVQAITGPDRISHYNLFTVADFFGSPKPGYSSGQAIATMEQLCRQILPARMGYEWTGLSYQEIKSGNTAIYIFPLSVLVVFLALAAQYESWSLPLSVILIVPTCLLSAIAGVYLRGSDNNIFTQIGFIVLVGLACKNAILIVEFARTQRESGKDRADAAVEACRIRLRPILMTSVAFIFGVLPLVVSSGPGAEMRQALGTAVFSGMIGVTLFGLLLTPVFFYVLSRPLRAGNQAGVKAGK